MYVNYVLELLEKILKLIVLCYLTSLAVYWFFSRFLSYEKMHKFKMYKLVTVISFKEKAKHCVKALSHRKLFALNISGNSDTHTI